LTFILFYEKASYAISALWTTEQQHFRSAFFNSCAMSPGAARSDKYCSIQGFLAAHWPPFALSRRMTICRHSCKFVNLPIPLGKEEFCNLVFLVCWIVRKQRQEGGCNTVSEFSVTRLGASETGGFFRHQPG